MTSASQVPYGSWPTPVTSALVVRAAARLGEVAVDGDDVWWSESRPGEGGRSALVRRCADGTVADVLPPPWNARTRVHEYGGAAWAVSGGTLWFTHFDDQRLYRLAPGDDGPVAVPRSRSCRPVSVTPTSRPPGTGRCSPSARRIPP